MAGIAGIILKGSWSEKESPRKVFASMMKKLSVSDSQTNRIFTAADVCFGNVVPVSCRKNDHFQYNDELGIHAAIDGLVFVDSHERSYLSKRYAIDDNLPDCSYLPFLYAHYNKEFAAHISGWFNIFIYDEQRKSSLLINDRLGFLPLYCYESDLYFIFASKIEAILNSGLVPTIKPDAVTIAEHLFFNYPLSDHTYIENIHILFNAECLVFRQNKITRTKYWSIRELYDYPPADKNESFRLIDQGLRQAIRKIPDKDGHKLNVSLTGGWDSRVVLSYLLPEHKDKLKLYSFGAAGSDDIAVPQTIARKESLDYTPYVLDQNYLDRCFMPEALKTIALSNGTRNYKRTHYLHAIRKISEISPFLVTGIFGDEVFKVGQPGGGDVFSKNTVELLQSDFDIDYAMKLFSNASISNCLQCDSKDLADAFRARLKSLKDQMDDFDTVSRKYYSLRFEYNLRKYFGSEANSYNDFVFCFSPFIDRDFLENFARTRYFGIHYPFDTNSIRLKKRSTRLYHDIVHLNYMPLTAYNSGRGYSMKDATTLPGNLKILYRKYFKNRKWGDAFNTKPTDTLFRTFLKTKGITSEILKMPDNYRIGVDYPGLLSLIYWIGTIEEKYAG